MKVLIVYYSTYGNVYRMAQLVAHGIKLGGAEPVIRMVPELIPESIQSRPDIADLYVTPGGGSPY